MQSRQQHGAHSTAGADASGARDHARHVCSRRTDLPGLVTRRRAHGTPSLRPLRGAYRASDVATDGATTVSVRTPLGGRMALGCAGRRGIPLDRAWPFRMRTRPSVCSWRIRWWTADCDRSPTAPIRASVGAARCSRIYDRMNGRRSSIRTPSGSVRPVQQRCAASRTGSSTRSRRGTACGPSPRGRAIRTRPLHQGVYEIIRNR